MNLHSTVSDQETLVTVTSQYSWSIQCIVGFLLGSPFQYLFFTFTARQILDLGVVLIYTQLCYFDDHMTNIDWQDGVAFNMIDSSCSIRAFQTLR